MNPSVCILLLTDDPANRSRWAEMLAPTNGRVFSGVKELADDAALDVIVTDRGIVKDALQSHNKQLTRGELGIVAIGNSPLADVNLPADCSGRELRLSCLLLAEIVRLRRERRAIRRRSKVLSQLALTDPLTGLLNRRAWNEQLPGRVRAAQTSARPYCLALFDLDNFKDVNDQFGHTAGDDVLRCVGRTLAEQTRAGRAFVARLGGDEFGVFIPAIDPASSFQFINDLRCELYLQQRRQHCRATTASAGFTESIVAHQCTLNEIVSAADLALRQAKQQGRNQTIAARLT